MLSLFLDVFSSEEELSDRSICREVLLLVSDDVSVSFCCVGVVSWIVREEVCVCILGNGLRGGRTSWMMMDSGLVGVVAAVAYVFMFVLVL